MADGGGGGGGGAGLGKGAWDCDAGKAIPPEAEAAVFEEASRARARRGGSPSTSAAGRPRPAFRALIFFPPPSPPLSGQNQQQIATMDMPFEGIPTVPPPKDRDRVAFFAGGCRYLVSAKPGDTVAAVKGRLFAGGIARAYPPGEVAKAEDLELYYACVRMDEPGATLGDYRVPAVRVWRRRRVGKRSGDAAGTRARWPRARRCSRPRFHPPYPPPPPPPPPHAFPPLHHTHNRAARP